MNTISVESVKEAVNELNKINYFSDLSMRDAVQSILQELFGIDKKNINTYNWTGDIITKFDSLSIKSGLSDRESEHFHGVRIIPEEISEVKISYLNEKKDSKLSFEPNFFDTCKVIALDNGRKVERFYYERNLLELISTIVYMSDNKIKGYELLPKFEKEICNLLSYYKIYPKDIS